MSDYTVEIQASNADGSIWQAMAPAENVIDAVGTDAGEVAQDVMLNQNIADEAAPFRIAVWEGADADTATEPAFVLDFEPTLQPGYGE